MEEVKLVNIIGFNLTRYSRWYPTKTCVIHKGNVLIPKQENGVYEPGVLWCPECGMSVSFSEKSG